MPCSLLVYEYSVRTFAAIAHLDRYVYDMRANLTVESPQLIRRLGELIEFKFNPHVELLDFEMFVEPTRHEISIRMFSMDRLANEVFGERESGFSGSTEVVDDISYFDGVYGNWILRCVFYPTSARRGNEWVERKHDIDSEKKVKSPCKSATNTRAKEQKLWNPSIMTIP